MPGGAGGGHERLQGHVLPAASPGLFRVLARFPRGHGLRQGPARHALAVGAGRGRGRAIRERSLGRGSHVISAPVARGPAALASP